MLHSTSHLMCRNDWTAIRPPPRSALFIPPDKSWWARVPDHEVRHRGDGRVRGWGGEVAGRDRTVAAEDSGSLPPPARAARRRGEGPSSPGRLVEVAAQWVELAEAKDGVPAGMAVEVLTEVADLARTAGETWASPCSAGTSLPEPDRDGYPGFEAVLSDRPLLLTRLGLSTSQQTEGLTCEAGLP